MAPTFPKFNIWRQQTSIFQQVAAYDFGGAGLNITGGDHPQQVQGIHVTADYFAMFGAPVVAGRTFTAAEDSPNGGHVTVLSYGLWKSRYGANPKIVGTTIQLDGQPYLVVGVIGRGFVTDTAGDLWVPFQFDPNSQDMAHYFTVAARLKPGVTLRRPMPSCASPPTSSAAIRRDSLPPDGGFGVVPFRKSMIGDTALSAARSAGRCRLCAPHRLRQCGQSAAGTRLVENANSRPAPRSEPAAARSSANC